MNEQTGNERRGNARAGARSCRRGLTALLVAAALTGSAPRAKEPDRDPPRNVLLIVSDTLRSDALGCDGGAAAAAHLCALAARGVLFERAYSAAARTLPSSVAMFTGNHAAGYARVPRRGSASPGKRGAYFYVLDDEVLLAERLRRRGYDVVADIENPVAEQSNNLQGFRRIPQAGARAVREAASLLGVDIEDPRYRRALGVARYLLDAPPGPFFLLQWIEDPHAAYAPPEHLRRRVAVDSAQLPHPLAFYAGLGPRALRKRTGSLTKAEIDALKRLYLAEVESVDERVDVSLRALERAGLRDRTLVVFLSDHGEGFGEHGRFLHGNSFYDELVHIPLVMAGPGLPRGRRLREAVSHVDLMPTLAELLGVGGGEAVQGRSLAPLLQGRKGRLPAAAHYIGDSYRWRKVDALVDGSYKLISRPGGIELYDLVEDPGETHDLADERKAVAARMFQQMVRIRAENERRRRRNLAFDDRRVLDRTRKATREQLRALGYID